MDPGGAGIGGPDPPGKLFLLYFPLEILVPTLLEKQLAPLGPIASLGRLVWPTLKYIDTVNVLYFELYLLAKKAQTNRADPDQTASEEAV